MANGEHIDHHNDELPVYSLRLNGDWGLWELSGFGRQYVQTYSFFHVLTLANQGDEVFMDRLSWALRTSPWKGGWSAVDFFQALVNTVPRDRLPRIRRIQYSSPGFIEISLGIISVAYVIRACCKTYDQLHDSYHRTYKAAKKRQLLSLDVRKMELDVHKREIEFVDQAVTELSAVLQLRPFEGLFRDLNTNRLALLKVLFALCRRIEPMAKLQDDDQVKF